MLTIDLYKKVDVSRIMTQFAEEIPKARSCLLVLSFLKNKRSQYYGKFEANFSIYIGQMSFHIRRINFICFYIRLYIILLS